MLTTTAQRVILLSCLFFAGSSLAEDKTPPPSKNDTAAPQRLFDFKITPEMQTKDLDDPKSALSKLIAYIVKGKSAASEYVSIERTRAVPEIKIQIKDDSIFVPGGNEDNKQLGFRRTDVNAAADPATTQTGISTFYQSLRFDSKAPLVLKHFYLLGSIEGPDGNHVWDLVLGSDFDSKNVENIPSKNANTIRVRDLTTKTLFDLPFDFDTIYNFAIQVDWTENTLTVYASTNQDPLKMVAGPAKNDDRAKAIGTKGEYHLQLIKFPLVDKSLKESDRSDVPHRGLQEKIKKEHIFVSNVYVTSGKEIQQPQFAGKAKKHSRCKL